jgi:hypothetical protein
MAKSSLAKSWGKLAGVDEPEGGVVGAQGGRKAIQDLLACQCQAKRRMVHALMNLTTVSVSDLNKIIKLKERREALAAKVAALDEALGAFDKDQASEPMAAAPSAPRGKGRKPGRGRKRGEVKARILGLLQEAGGEGLRAKEIAQRMGVNSGRIHVWFSVNKKNKQIKKVGPGRYAWVG